MNDRDGARQLTLYDFAKKESRALTTAARVHSSAAWAPDGKRLAYAVDGEEIRVRTLADGSEKTLYTGKFGRGGVSIAWSPDGEWLAAFLPGVKNFRNAWLLRTDGSAKEQVSWLPNMFGGDVSWTPDGTALLFVTGQRTEHRRVAILDLKPRAPEFREEAFRKLFEKPGRSGEEGNSEDRIRAGGLAGPVAVIATGDGRVRTGSESGREDAGVCRELGGAG